MVHQLPLGIALGHQEIAHILGILHGVVRVHVLAICVVDV